MEPVFVITREANRSITATTLNGMRVDISSFRLGSDFETPAVSTEVDLQGTTVYSGAPSSYFYYDEDTVGIRLEVPADVGPFQFGEVGLFSSSGMMVARASLGSLQTKFGPSAGGMPNVWRITALLRFAQAPSIFVINTFPASSIPEVAHFGLLAPPDLMIAGHNIVIVHEPSPHQESTLVYRHSPTHWTISGYEKRGYITLSASSNPGQIPSADWANFVIADYEPGKYLVQTLDGDIRSIQSLTGSMGVPTVSMPVLPSGSVLQLYSAVDQKGVHTNIPVSHFAQLVAEFNSFWSSPSGSSVYDSRGIGQPAVPLPLNPVSVQDSEWWLLLDRVRDYARLLGIEPAIDIRGLNGDWSNNYFSQLRKYNSLLSLLDQFAVRDPGDVPMRMTDRLDHETLERNSTWSDIQCDSEFIFSDESTMRSFFNAGGWVGFQLSVTPDNYTQQVQGNMLSQLGLIRFNATKAESTGPLKVIWEDGDGSVTDVGNCGFLGLNTGWKTIWSFTVVAATGTGAVSEEGVVQFSMRARRDGPTLMVGFTVQDRGREEYVEDTKGGVPSILCTVSTGRPAAVISDTPLLHPQFSSSPTTNW